MKLKIQELRKKRNQVTKDETSSATE